MTKEDKRRLTRLRESLQALIKIPACNRNKQQENTIKGLRAAIETLTKSKP